MKTFNIRNATSNDMAEVVALITELAVFENEPDAVEVSEANLIEHGFGSSPKFSCWVAERDKQIIGMALCYPRYSTWKGPTFHLEDLIVTKEERGKGVGKALYSTFIEHAHQQGVRRIEWVVLDWNTHAVDFYKNSGAEVLSDWRTVQMDKQAIQHYIERNEDI